MSFMPTPAPSQSSSMASRRNPLRKSRYSGGYLLTPNAEGISEEEFKNFGDEADTKKAELGSSILEENDNPVIAVKYLDKDLIENKTGTTSEETAAHESYTYIDSDQRPRYSVEIAKGQRSSDSEKAMKPVNTNENTETANLAEPAKASKASLSTRTAEPNQMAEMGEVAEPTEANDERGPVSHRLTAATRGVDLSLPPLSDIGEIFTDIARKASKEGFRDVIDHLNGRPLRIATMCSGTESPLLAMQLLSQGLKELNEPSLQIEHLFSAEIVPFKQAYIERNFQPPIIFRDITQMKTDHSGRLKATTVYGSEVEVPKHVDILVAGFSCVDFSGLNNHRLNIKDGGESGETFAAIYKYAMKERPTIIILENVLTAPWKGIEQEFRSIGYEARWAKMDTKNYYIPHTRQRGYIFCLDVEAYGSGSAEAAESWWTLVKRFERRASCSVASFLLPASDSRVQQYRAELARVSEDDTGKEVDWEKCRARYEAYRRNEKLGSRRPLTHWVDNGTCKVPEYADRAWYKKQVERVWDTLDCALLRNARPERGSYDSQYKTRVWELSQNIDRFTDTAQFGIASCQTPTGSPYLTDRGGPLTGYETLSLQGIPLDKISFTSETNKQRQDLAGNAMTSTVVGTAMVAALLVGFKALKTVQSNIATPPESVIEEVSPLKGEETLSELTLNDQTHPIINIDCMLAQAQKSARRCYCEGQTVLSKKPIRICSKCGHTTCIECGGSPSHAYGADKIKKDARLAPHEFERQWKPLFPACLVLESPPNLDVLRETYNARIDSSLWEKYREAIKTALPHDFYLQSFDRSTTWTVSYQSTAAKLDLSLHSTPEWRLYIKADASWPGDSKLRRLFERPIARAKIVSGWSILDVHWQWFLPSDTKFELSIRGTGGQTESWLSRIGLEEFESQTVSKRLIIQATGGGEVAQHISGDYELLPDCGTACGSLHVRLQAPEEGGDPLFFFLDPAPIGDPAKDHFVFSRDHHRLDYGEKREVLARVHPSWRPWDKKAERVLGYLDGLWVTPEESETKLQAVKTKVIVHAPLDLPVWDELREIRTCSDITSLLTFKFRAHPELLEHWAQSQSVSLDDQSFFRSAAWIFRQHKNIEGLKTWRPINSTIPAARCQTCSPTPPPNRWKIDPKGSSDNHTSLVSYEDQHLACIFEEQRRNRPPIFRIETSVDELRVGHIKIGLNVQSLAHRAAAILDNGAPSSISWRLCTNYVPPLTGSFPAFEITSNITDEPYGQPLQMQIKLRKEQKRSLTWMRAQEAMDVSPFTLEEVEEALVPSLGWRAEARARREISVRGGVLADQVSYGKTVTTLAMIHAHFLENKKEEILADMEMTCQTEAESGLIQLAATLIVCPPLLPYQWRSEIEKCLGSAYKRSEIIIIKTAADLSKYCIRDYQEAKIIIISWNVFDTDAYVAEVARFAAIPEPTSTQGRGFKAWFDHASKEFPLKVQQLRDAGVARFKKMLRQQFSANLDHEQFKAIVPSKRLRGKAYAERRQKGISTLPATAGKKRKVSDYVIPETTAAPQRDDWQQYPAPLPHFFRFNRVVVDEYTYLDKRELTSILDIKADKRWVLSGTPALRDFADVKRIASFLGINLGMGVASPMGLVEDNIRKINKELTPAELFHLSRDSRSVAWHEWRHQHAQEFLNKFVRQNDAELGEISCADSLKPLILPSDQCAIYMELSQHLCSQDMRMKKNIAKFKSNRESLLNNSLGVSATPEEALINCCALRVGSDASCAALIDKRRSEYEELKQELQKLLNEAEQLRCLGDDEDPYYPGWYTGLDENSLGDKEVTAQVKWMRLQALRSLEEKDTKDVIEIMPKKEALNRLRSLADDLRATSRELTSRHRSLRYVKAIQQLQRSFSRGGQKVKNLCECAHCSSRPVGDDEISVLSLCGHIACDTCLEARAHKESCFVPGCKASVNDYHLVKAKVLGVEDHSSQMSKYGKKVDELVKLINSFPEDDQAILFVQNNELLNGVEDALNFHHITCHAIRSKAAKASDKIEDFQVNRDKTTRKKLLILNLSDASAAGSNLTNANHVIFLSPLLAKSQQMYEASMTQAIGRARRYGQQKRVHIYRFVALRTIDVDILEHRERRADALWAYDDLEAPTQGHLTRSKKQKTKLTQDASGRFALVPRSWMTEGSHLNLSKESFGSLTKFSPAFLSNDFDD